MKTFKELYEACCAACEKRADIEEVKEPTGDLKDACWKGYTAVGMKMKNGRKVPNCVPANEEVEQIDEGLHPKLTKAAEVLRSAGHVVSHIEQGYHKKTRKKIGLIRYTDSNTGGKIAKNVQLEEVEQIDEISKDLASRYLRKIERQPGLDKDHPEKRKPKKFGSQKIGYERAFNKVSPFGKHRVKVQATEETTPGKNVVPPHVGALATGGVVKEEDGENKPLGKVMRAGDGKKKFKVYVKNAKGNVVKVGFGDPNMEIKRSDPERRKNFRARHNCATASDRTTPRYWSCRNWRAGAKVEA